ncbi:MAG: hypothetical protein IKE58_06965 [Blautia sp.]|nr:hypothetical protein [Blautia sp.]
MNEVRDLIIGIDFGKESSQIAVYDRKASEPCSISETVGSSDFEIPTTVCLRHKNKAFCIGTEAKYFSSQNEGTIIPDLLSLCLVEADTVEIDGETWPLSYILAGFLTCLLKMTGISHAVSNTSCIAIGVETLTPELVRHLSAACEEAGFARDNYLLMDYPQCFFYYAMTQRRENWNRNIGWYEFRQDTVLFSRLSVQSQSARTPITVRLQNAGQTTLPPLPQQGTERDDAFALFIKKTLSSDLYSTILLTGNGFSKDWSERSVKILIQQQRKAFYGNNLFAKGACAGAKERKEDKKLKAYRFLSDSMVLSNVGMDLLVMGTPAYHPLIVAGRNWYEYHISCEIILDETAELVFIVSQAGSTEKRKVAMKLDGLIDRPPRTNRILLSMKYLSKDDCEITVEDLGFGEMFPSTGKTWTEVVNWGEESV